MKIGKYEIKKTSGYNVVDINKRTKVLNKKTGEMEIKEGPNEASNSYLTWSLKGILRDGDKMEQANSKAILELLGSELSKNKIVDNDDHIAEYRKIEGKFFDSYGKLFEAVNGEIQIKLF